MKILSFILILIFTHNSDAIIVEAKTYGGGRLKSWRYSQNNIYKYTGFVQTPAYIQFEDGESVSSIAVGVPEKWSFENKGNVLWLKPLTDDGDTLATITTTKRIYFFELHVKTPSSPFDPRLTLGSVFQYPTESIDSAKEGAQDTVVLEYAKEEISNIVVNPQNNNFNYSMAGDDVIAPTKVFDDGKFTYIEFSKNNATKPAIFGVDSRGYEFILNYRTLGDYTVIESVNSIYTLRYGSDTLCIFNNSYKQTMNAAKREINKDKINPFDKPPELPQPKTPSNPQSQFDINPQKIMVR